MAFGAYPCHDTCRGTLSDAPPPPLPPPPLRVMVARPAQVTQVTQVPNPLLHEPLHGIPCHRPPPPPPPPCHGGTRAIFKPQRAMGLGHSTSPVLSTHVNLLCKDANKFTQFLLFKKCMHWGSSMHARRR